MTEKTPRTEPDMLTINTLYAITINPNDSKQYFTHGNRISKVREHFINKHFLHWRDTMVFDLYPEFSNPWKQYYKKDGKSYTSQSKPTRLHYHGIIQFKSLHGWYSYFWNKLIEDAQVELDTINDKDIWAKYITKNKETMKSICINGLHRYKIDSYDLRETKTGNKR